MESPFRTFTGTSVERAGGREGPLHNPRNERKGPGLCGPADGLVRCEGTGLKGPHCPLPQQWGRLGREGGVAQDHTQGAGLGSWLQKTHCLTWAPGEGVVS